MSKLETIARAFGVITSEKFSGEDELRGLIAKRADGGERLAADFRKAHPRMFSLQPGQIPVLQAFGPPPQKPLSKPRDPNAPVVVNCDLHGAGDAIIMAWIAQGAAGKLRLYATGAKKELLELFSQDVVGSSEGASDTFAAYAVETKAKGAEVRVKQRGAFLGVMTPPERPPYRLDPAKGMEFAKSLGDRPTLLYPGCDDGTREWPPFYWLDLYHRLAAAGMNPHVFCRDPDYRYANLPNYHERRTWSENMHAMLAAGVVVGNDSGPMHVAGTLDVPMIALLGPTTYSMCCHMPSVITLAASEEEIFCVGCWHNTPEFRNACRYGCAALGHILPKTVFETIERTRRDHQAQ